MNIPDTPLTENLRHLWQVMQDLADGGDGKRESFEDFYASTSELGGIGSPNGRALAAVLFYRGCQYWPDFFRPTDTLAVNTWGSAIDRRIPFATPDVIERAVDRVAFTGAHPGGPASFLDAADQIMKEDANDGA